MIFGRRLFARYIVAAAVPYILLTLALLSAILFAQQAGRIAEIAIYAQVPFSVLAQIAAAIMPGVLVFSIPTAILAGIIIGYARMGSDSEIVAMRAAGVGTWTMIWPLLVLGLVATAAATYIHMLEAPRAARDIRKAAIQGALRKLNSPVEPRTFTTEIPKFVIYVRDGNTVSGSWGRVFIYTQEEGGADRVVTARSGRIDSSTEKSELVLNDAVATKLPKEGDKDQNYVAERFDQLRIAINTGRAALLKKLTEDELGPDERDWDDLKHRAYFGTPRQQNEAKRTLHRRVALSISPFLFAILGGAIGIRVKRGGRGLGVVLSLVILVSYYLLSLFGESSSRAGAVSPEFGAWAATVVMVIITAILLTIHRLPRIGLTGRSFKHFFKRERPSVRIEEKRTVGAARIGFPSLMDIHLFRTLAISFAFGFVALVSIFVIFTLFELWRFIASSRASLSMVGRYVLYLLPLVSVELFPATMLISVLVTYALLARRHEAIAWWASGQSVYRLMVPGLLFALAVGAGLWLIQERLMPNANIKQDALRAQIRGGEARAITGTGKQWLASLESNRLYSYEYDEHANVLREPVVYDFDPEGVHLTGISKADHAFWTAPDRLTLKDTEIIALKGLEVDHQKMESAEVARVETPQIFRPTVDKPSQLSSEGLSTYLKSVKRRGMEASTLTLALQRKYAAPFGALVMAFIGIPLALSFGRKGAVIALAAAVAVSVAYLGVGGGFQQLGIYGLLPPAVAAWSPPVIFAAAGTYFLSRLRT